MKRLLQIFLTALVLNAIWENLHSYLYAAYKGGEVTQFILLRASVFDALLITLIALPFLYSNVLKRHSWLIVLFGLCVATINEWYGLSTGRWEYNVHMPIVPILGVGLTPFLQLGILGFCSYVVAGKFIRK